MASNDAWKVLLQVELDKNSKKTIVDQLLSLQKGIESLDVKVNIDDEQLGKLKTKISNLSKTTKIFDTTDGTKKLVKEIEKTEDAMGNVVTITKTQKKEMTEVTENYDKQNKYLQKSVDIYDEIEKSVNRIFDVDKDLDGFIDKNELNKIMDSFSDISIDIDGMTTDLTKVNKLVSTLNKELDSVEKNAKSMANSIRMAQVKKDYDSHVKSEQMSSDNVYTYTASSIDQQISSREKQARMFSNALKEQMQLEYKRAELMAEDVEREIKDQERLEKQIREVNLAKKVAISSIENIKKTKDNYDVSEAKRLINEINKIPPEAEDAKLSLRELNAEIKTFGSNALKSSTVSNSFNDSLQRWASFVGLYEMFQLGKRAISDMTSSVITLDTELTNLMKVSDITSDKLGKFTDGMFEAASKLGRTGTELTNAVANFAQAGYSADNGTATQLGEQAILMQNIGDGIDSVDTATSVLISTMKAYNLTANESVKINDILNQVSNTSAVSFSKLADMIGRSSALMAQGNTSIEELAGMATAAYEIIQSSERVSTSLNTISLRIRALKTGVSEVDGEPIAKMGEVLDKFNIKIIDSQGELRDFYDIMQDLAGAYKTMSTADKQLVTQSIGGARNSAVLSALLTNWEAGQVAINEALNSTGSALKENSIFIESLQGRINLLNSAWQQLATSSINSEFVKSIIDMTTGMIKFMDACGGVIPLLSTILGLLIAIKAQKIGSFIMDGVGVIIPSLKKLISVIGLVSTGWMNMSGAMAALNVSASTLATGGIGILVVALGALTMAYNANKQAQEERVVSARESQQTINDELKSTSQLMARYKELSSIENKTKENREELLSIQKQLAEMHGVEARGLDLLNESYEENANVINRATEAKRRYLEIDNQIISSDVNQKLADAMKQVITGSVYAFKGDNGIGEAFRQLNEELQNAFDVDTSGRGFILKISPEVDQELALRAIDELLKKMEYAGQSSSQDYINLAGVFKNLSDAIENASNHDKTMQEQAIKNKIYIDAQSKSIKDLSSANVAQIQTLEQMYIARSVLEKGQGSALQAQKEFRDAIVEANPSYAEYLGITSDVVNEVETLAEEIQVLNGELTTQCEEYDLLVSSIQKLTDGQELSGDEIHRLTSAYGDLVPKIDATTGQMYLERDALIELAKNQGNDAQQAITAQINKTKQLATSTASRIGLMSKEVLAINSLSDAYRLLAANATSSTGGYRPQGMDDRTWSNSAANMNTGINSIIKDLADLYEQAEKTASGIDKVTGWDEENKKKSSSPSSKKDNTISDAFKKDLAEISKLREETETKIDELQEAINLDELLGEYDPDKANKMTDLLSQLKGIADIEMGKLNGLKKVYKQQEQLAEIESLMAAARKQQFTDEMSYQQHMIDLINKKYDAEKRSYDDKVRLINLEQKLHEQGSVGYEALEQQKMDLLIGMQQSYMDKVRELKESGLSQDSEDVRNYIDLWKDAQEEILSIDLEMQKRRRQAEIDSMKKQEEQMKSVSDAKKKILDETIAMIKAEEKARDDAAKKRIKTEVDNMKKLADERKRELQRQKDERSYQKDVDKSNEEISSIQRELDKLMFDNSEWAIAEKLRLAKELADKEEALKDKQLDKEIDKQMDAIDEQVKLFEEQKNKELEIIEDNAMTEYEIRKKALDMIDKDNKKLYKELQKHMLETGKMGKEEFDGLWKVANTGLEQFGIKTKSTLESLDEMYLAMKKLADESDRLSKAPIGGYSPNTGSGNNVNSGDSKKINQMIANSQAWAKAKTQEERDRLSAENQKLGKELGLYYNAGTGKWYRDSGYRIPAWHNGLEKGQVGTGLKPNELIAKLTNDEWVFTGKQFDNLTNNLKGMLPNSQRGIGDIVLNLYGTVTEGAKPMLKEWTKDIEKICYKVVNKSM